MSKTSSKPFAKSWSATGSRCGSPPHRKVMRIAFLSAVYKPEREPAAVMAAQLVDRWIEEGNQVDVYCPFPNRPEGLLRRGWKRRLRQRSARGRLREIRCWHWLVGRERRIWNR